MNNSCGQKNHFWLGYWQTFCSKIIFGRDVGAKKVFKIFFGKDGDKVYVQNQNPKMGTGGEVRGARAIY